MVIWELVAVSLKASAEFEVCIMVVFEIDCGYGNVILLQSHHGIIAIGLVMWIGLINLSILSVLPTMSLTECLAIIAMVMKTDVGTFTAAMPHAIPLRIASWLDISMDGMLGWTTVLVTHMFLPVHSAMMIMEDSKYFSWEINLKIIMSFFSLQWQGVASSSLSIRMLVVQEFDVTDSNNFFFNKIDSSVIICHDNDHNILSVEFF